MGEPAWCRGLDPRRRGLGWFMAGVVLVTACTSSGESPPDTLDATPSTTRPPTSTSTPPPSTTTTMAPETEVLSAWSSYWSAYADLWGAEVPDPQALSEVAGPQVVDAVGALLDQRPAPVDITVNTYPKVEELSESRALLRDCVLFEGFAVPDADEPELQHQSSRHEAVLERVGEAWQLSSVSPPSLGSEPCVPAEVEQEVFTVYDAYLDALFGAWFTPEANPEHATIDELTAGVRHDNLVRLLTEYQERDLVLRGRPEGHPEVIQAGPDKVIVLDCYLKPADHGVYNRVTGERTDIIPPESPGTTGLQSLEFAVVDGLWKLVDNQVQETFACEFAPTSRHLPSV